MNITKDLWKKAQLYYAECEWNRERLGREKLAEYLGVNHQTARTLLMALENQDLFSGKEPEPTEQEPAIEDACLLRFLGTKPRTLLETANQFGVAPAVVESAVKSLVDRKLLIETDGTMIIKSDSIPKADPYFIDTRKNGISEIIIGGVADTHLGSKYERLDVLNSLYDRFADAGVTHVYHGGNWIDGEKSFNKTDIHTHGLGNQVDYFIEKYPHRKGIKTYIISGDDHEGWYVQREAINIGAYMQMQAEKAGRDDLIDAGYMERDFQLEQKKGSATLRLIHAGGGSAYAISYTSQKYAESLQGGDKPQIVLVGHYHKFEYGYPREVHMVQLGCCQDQTPFMRKRKLQAMVGGCIIRIKQADNGIIIAFDVEWMPYYDKKFYQYRW